MMNGVAPEVLHVSFTGKYRGGPNDASYDSPEYHLFPQATQSQVAHKEGNAPHRQEVQRPSRASGVGRRPDRRQCFRIPLAYDRVGIVFRDSEVSPRNAAHDLEELLQKGTHFSRSGTGRHTCARSRQACPASVVITRYQSNARSGCDCSASHRKLVLVQALDGTNPADLSHRTTHLCCVAPQEKRSEGSSFDRSCWYSKGSRRDADSIAERSRLSACRSSAAKNHAAPSRSVRVPDSVAVESQESAGPVSQSHLAACRTSRRSEAQVSCNSPHDSKHHCCDARERDCEGHYGPQHDQSDRAIYCGSSVDRPIYCRNSASVADTAGTRQHRLNQGKTLEGASRTCAPVASHASPRQCGEQTGTAMEASTLSRVASERNMVRLRGRLPLREAGGKAALPAGRFSHGECPDCGRSLIDCRCLPGEGGAA